MSLLKRSFMRQVLCVFLAWKFFHICLKWKGNKLKPICKLYPLYLSHFSLHPQLSFSSYKAQVIILQSTSIATTHISSNSRKVQIMKMLREGHRRSPRISALDAWKAQPPRSTTVAKKTRLSTSITGTSNNTTEVQDKELEQQKGNQPEGPASRTRAKKKRKLRPLQDVDSTPNAQEDSKSSDESDDRQLSYEDHPFSSNEPTVQNEDSPKKKLQAMSPDQPSSLPSASRIPEKRMLEHIIDILQRRDTHEIFAEPVDPNEVEEYYEIIKEPMDFGTMRAKLHEGMYKSLEQFEHDVFLISRNAMHFNSSSTIYFRQARAIDELAKKVFHVLKTDPNSFELEFSGTRRRTGRRPQYEAKSSTNFSSPKIAMNSKSNNTAVNILPKPTPCLTSCSSSLRRAMRMNSGSLGFNTHSDKRVGEVLCGTGESRRSSSSETDRPCTIIPSMSFLNETCPIISSMYSNSKPLVHVNQNDNAYCKSLMLFVNDLGPTAQMIARCKLNGGLTSAANFLTPDSICWPEASTYQNFAASTSSQQIPSPLDATITATSPKVSMVDRIDRRDADKRKSACAGNKLSMPGTSTVVAPNSNYQSKFGAIRDEACFSDGMGVSRNDKSQQNQNRWLQVGDVRDQNILAAGLSNKSNESTMLKLQKSKLDNKSQSLESVAKDSEPNAWRNKLSDSYRFSSSHWPLKTMGMSSFTKNIDNTHCVSKQCLRGDGQGEATQDPRHGVGVSSETIGKLDSSEQYHFIFDLPFLKTRLDQINTSGHSRFLQHGSGMQGLSEAYNDDHAQSSMNTTQHANLALQL